MQSQAVRPRVVLVDDNAALRASIRELLTDSGVEVLGEAGDGVETLRAIPPAASAGPLVVLMDVRMPGAVNGIEATRLLLDRCRHVAVVIFTAFPSEGIERAARRAGAVDLLAKGVPAAEVVRSVERAWAGMVPVGG